MSGFTQGLWTGASLGGIYALMSLALALVYTSSRILNIAQGGVMAVAAFITSSLVSASGSGYLAVLVCALVTAMGMALLQLGLSTVAERLGDSVIVASLGLLFVGSGVIEIVWGPNARSLPSVGGTVLRLPGGIMTIEQVVTIVLMVLLAGAVAIMLKRSRLGLALRAVADSPEGAATVGVRILWVRVAAAAGAGLLAGAAGGLLVPSGGVDTSSGLNWTVIAVVAAMVGGIDSIWGAFLGGFVLGEVNGLMLAFAPSYFLPVEFAVLLAVLIARPTGLAGRQLLRRI